MASVGETLRSAREQRGLSIEQVSHDTRISARFLDALESDRYDALPAPVYVRGFIRSYASYLKLDGGALIAKLSADGVPGLATAATTNTIASPPRQDARRVDPFRRDETAASPLPPPAVVKVPEPPVAPAWAEDEDADFASRQTIRRPVQGVPGRPLPPPPIPPGRFDDDLDEDGYLRPHGVAVLAEENERRAPSRNMALAGIGLLGVAVAVVTAVLLTRGDGNGIATAVPDATTTRSQGTVVAVGSRTPAGAAVSPTPTNAVPGQPSGGTAAPSASPTSEDETPPAEEPTPTPAETSETDTPTVAPTATATVPAPTEVPTPIPTPTQLATFTPTTAPVPFHPLNYQECSNFECGPPPLRVICPPDGTWFVDVGSDYPNPGWPETTVTLSSQAAVAGANRCQ